MLKATCHCGLVSWKYEAAPESVTACNCTLCSRYGALWAYGFLGEGIEVSGSTQIYSHGKKISEYHHCSQCACLSYYVVRNADEKGRRKIAVNLRMLADQTAISHLPIDHFDGLTTFDDLPHDGRCVKDLWF